MTTPNTPVSTKPAPDMAVEAVIQTLMRLIDKHVGNDSDMESMAKLRDALRAALARPQEVAGVTEEDAAETLKLVCDAFGIGSVARSRSTILANVENAKRRADCLWAVERAYFVITEPDEDDPDGEPVEIELLNWGDDPDRYVERFGEALAASRAPVAVGVEPSRWHELKTDPESFDALMRGEKTYEIRRNDRDFKVGDGLLLRRTKYTGNQMHMRPEACPLEYTGEECRRVVSHIVTGYGLENYCALSLATPAPSVPLGGGEVPVAPSKCPITGRKFWGNISHPELGLVATYGGPLDTYTIPQRSDDGELRCERFDQDAGHWVEGGEPMGWYYADQQALQAQDAAPVEPKRLFGKDEIDDMLDELRNTHGLNGDIEEVLDVVIAAFEDRLAAAPVEAKCPSCDMPDGVLPCCEDCPQHDRKPLPAGVQGDAARIVWPKEKRVGRREDMSPDGTLIVGLDNDNDVYVEVSADRHGEWQSAAVEFCNGGVGGGQSSRTRAALINLMTAIEADNAEMPHKAFPEVAAQSTKGA